MTRLKFTRNFARIDFCGILNRSSQDARISWQSHYLMNYTTLQLNFVFQKRQLYRIKWFDFYPAPKNPAFRPPGTWPENTLPSNLRFLRLSQKAKRKYVSVSLITFKPIDEFIFDILDMWSQNARNFSGVGSRSIGSLVNIHLHPCKSIGDHLEAISQWSELT